MARPAPHHHSHLSAVNVFPFVLLQPNSFFILHIVCLSRPPAAYAYPPYALALYHTPKPKTKTKTKANLNERGPRCMSVCHDTHFFPFEMRARRMNTVHSYPRP